MRAGPVTPSRIVAGAVLETTVPASTVAPKCSDVRSIATLETYGVTVSDTSTGPTLLEAPLTWKVMAAVAVPDCGSAAFETIDTLIAADPVPDAGDTRSQGWLGVAVQVTRAVPVTP